MTSLRKQPKGDIILRVWEAKWLKGSPGHAAIHIGNQYVSFWPGSEQGTLAWSGYKTKQHSEDLTTYQTAGQSHSASIIPSNDGGKKGLDKTAMLDKWAQIRAKKPDYTAKVQCSGVVNQLLLAGGSQEFAKTSLFSWSSWYIFAVSPDDVRDYCTTLVKKIKQARRSG